MRGALADADVRCRLGHTIAGAQAPEQLEPGADGGMTLCAVQLAEPRLLIAGTPSDLKGATSHARPTTAELRLFLHTRGADPYNLYL